ncbi:MAG: hypothetical protein OEZ01_03935 [Candidatus Heimdallarchaeota archaeon]|nr:hypothetical protein [Candidatus Heimdallarchaeota archaeon]MDH5645129.1 hypothetical protein [Candidatus Heimdallarchaeota archaeon]
MHKYIVTVVEIEEVANNIRRYILTKPDGFTFNPGQYCWLAFPGREEDRSPMAIASGLKDNYIEFTIRKWGTFTTELFSKEADIQLVMDGPHGTFFPLNFIDSTPIYLIGGGTGITPIKSLCLSTDKTSQISIFYGAQQPNALIFKNQIANWGAEVHLTVDHSDGSWNGNIGLVTDLIKMNTIDPNGYAFICGPTPMLKAVVNVLREKGLEDSKIYVSLERFDENGNVIGPVLPINDPIVGI